MIAHYYSYRCESTVKTFKYIETVRIALLTCYLLRKQAKIAASLILLANSNPKEALENEAIIQEINYYNSKLPRLFLQYVLCSVSILNGE